MDKKLLLFCGTQFPVAAISYMLFTPAMSLFL